MAPESQPDQKPATAMVMMPFDTAFDDVFDLIKSCVAAVDPALVARRADENLAAGRIDDDLVKDLAEATICIADVTGSNPNVMWEMGYAAALRKPVISISQSVDDLPFDIRQLTTLPYDRLALTATLRERLIDSIRQTLEVYRTAAQRTNAGAASVPARSIAITGSMDSTPSRVMERLRRTLAPHIGRQNSWYTGSFGIIDESAVRLLLELREESISVVGYSSYDISGDMLELVSSSDAAAFIDASDEWIPEAARAPSRRDVFLAARCDLFVVVWNGVSEGTRDLIQWLADQRKDHVLCFVPPTYSHPGTDLTR